jgi:D-alanyl-D-alanine dipeptidase
MELRKKIVTYDELLTVTASEKLMTPMVPLSEYGIQTKPWSEDMETYTPGMIFVRKMVAEKLSRINEDLKWNLGLEILVSYGYRHPAIQQKYFDEYCKKVQETQKVNREDLNRLVHNFIAVPSVAGHPTGGAVDLTFVRRNGEEVDMGTKIADFSQPELLPTFAQNLSSEQKSDRLMLRQYMLSENFAPFDGEWWHFSFGDKEWAYWYKKNSALCSQIDFTFKNLPE